MESVKVLVTPMEPFSEKRIQVHKIAIEKFIKVKNIIEVSRPYITLLSTIIIGKTKFHCRLAKINL